MCALKWTGLLCPFCNLAVAIISNRLPGVVVSFCGACGHRWTTPEPEVDLRVRFEYARDDERRRIYVTARQALRYHDFLAIIDRQLHEGTWTYGLLYDLGAFEITREEAGELTKRVFHHVEVYGNRGPIAVCAGKADLLETTNEYASNAETAGLRVAVFTERIKAEAWLDTVQEPPPISAQRN